MIHITDDISLCNLKCETDLFVRVEKNANEDDDLNI